MRYFPWGTLRLRTIGILLAFLLLMIGTPNAFATAATPVPDNNFYTLSVSQSKDPICVGDTVNVTVSWNMNSSYNPETKDGLVSLAPLTGPSRIKLQASLGSFYPDNTYTPTFTPGAAGGTNTIAYTAEKEGRATILAQAWSGGSSDAIDKDSFTIKHAIIFST